jgi:hypothetical protein
MHGTSNKPTFVGLILLLSSLRLLSFCQPFSELYFWLPGVKLQLEYSLHNVSMQS